MVALRSRWADLALALVLGVVGVVGSIGASADGDPDRSIDAVGLTLVIATAAALFWRRTRPLAVLVVASASTATYLAVGYPYGPILIAFFVAVYSAARHLPLRTSLPACAVALGVLLIHLVTNSAALPGLVGLVPGSAWVVVPYAVGWTVRQAHFAAERTRAELIREHVADERLRVSQEVHDVVGHGLAAIKMQADIALHVLDKQPGQARTALAAISRTSTEALEELRAALALVRRPDTTRTPGPGLALLDDLVRRMHDAGLTVDATVRGTPLHLAPATDLAAYRVVQESLTNVLRHSSGAVARLGLDWQPGSVTITVDSRGARATATDEGLGLPGMRHRVESVGGTFSAGPTPQGDFTVRAVLPVEAAAP